MSTYFLNKDWLLSLGFVETTELDEDIYSHGFIYYDEKNKAGFYLTMPTETDNSLFVYKFHGENENNKRNVYPILDGFKILSDDEMFFVLYRLNIVRYILQIPQESPFKKP